MLQRFMKENGTYHYLKGIKYFNHTDNVYGIIHYCIKPFDCFSWVMSKEGPYFWYLLSLKWIIEICHYLLRYEGEEETPLILFEYSRHSIIIGLCSILNDYPVPEKPEGEEVEIFEIREKAQAEIDKVIQNFIMK